MSLKIGETETPSPYTSDGLFFWDETGSVESMLERVADRYEADLRKTIKRLLSLFEPLVIICLGLCIGAIVLLMFLAIMDMQSAVN